MKNTHFNAQKISVIIFFLFFQKYSFAQKKVINEFQGQETKRILRFEEGNKFVLLNKKNNHVFQLDTLSYGFFEKNNSNIILNTPKNVETNILKIKVLESRTDSDSIKITINNPYEEEYHKKKINHLRFFNYYLQIDGEENEISPIILIQNNYVCISKKDFKKIYSIKVHIVPNSFYYPSKLAFNFLSTDLYIFNDKFANDINIEIPFFTFDYIGIERYKQEYLKIENKNKIILRGEFFTKIN
jgi:hypothetical protein